MKGPCKYPKTYVQVIPARLDQIACRPVLVFVNTRALARYTATQTGPFIPLSLRAPFPKHETQTPSNRQSLLHLLLSLDWGLGVFGSTLWCFWVDSLVAS